MKIFITLTIIFFSLIQFGKTESLLVLKNTTGTTYTMSSLDLSTNTETLLLEFDNPYGTCAGCSFVDEYNGKFYIGGGAGFTIYDVETNTVSDLSRPSSLLVRQNLWNGDTVISTGTDAEDNSSTTVLGSLDISDSNGNTLIEQDSTGTTIEIGEDSLGETGLIISNTASALDIQDGAGNTMIKVTSDGATHIGENSLVTKEVNGRQELYATDATGNRIDINIPSGTNLLIDGEDVMGSIDSSIALGAAFASLPTGAEGAGYTCGLGTGFHDSASAISGGCGFDFANYSFVNSMPGLFQKASFNIGAASVVHGEGDDATLKAGITFKFGAPKPIREARDDNLLLENKIDAVMQENRILKVQLKEENEAIRQENDLLKVQIAEINTQLKALNMVAMD